MWGFFLPFYGSIYFILSILFGEIFQNFRRTSNPPRYKFKKKKEFCKLMCSTAAKKNGLIDFPEKRAPTKVKHLLPACQVSRNVTEGNARKFSVSFAFCAGLVSRHS